MKIVFMGTPDYAVSTLEKLIEKGHEVSAVFAQPDKPVGRKHILTPPPVKVCAQKHNIPVYQPNTLKDGTAFNILKEISPDAIVVVAYGKILPKEILEIAPLGCINGHASLLPKYRGSAPIQWAIIKGEKVTGITTMLMDEGIDTGDILEQVEVCIGETETAEELFDRLADISANLMVSTLEKLKNGQLTPKKQPEENASYAPIIKKEMALIDFNKTAEEIYNAVRGFYSWPVAYFFLKNKRVKIISCAKGEKTDKPAGTVIDTKNGLTVACKNGTSIKLLTVQPEGSKAMTSKQMLCGNQVDLGFVIGENNG